MVRILVNCFLDEGSDTTYVNEGVVEELGVQRGERVDNCERCQ